MYLFQEYLPFIYKFYNLMEHLELYCVKFTYQWYKNKTVTVNYFISCDLKLI